MNIRYASLLACSVFFGTLSFPAYATSYTGHLAGFWVETDGSITWYAFDAKDKYGNLPPPSCSTTLFRLQKNQQNFVELYTSLLLAMKQNYLVSLETTSCAEGNKNIIDLGKICTQRLVDC